MLITVICLPYCLKFLTFLVIILGGWVGYRLAGFVFGDGLFSMFWYGFSSSSSSSSSIWYMPFLSTYGVSFWPL